MSSDAHTHDEPHIVPLPVYLTIFAALMVFTALTVWVAVFDLRESGFGTESLRAGNDEGWDKELGELVVFLAT
jgi:hypothetical protein